MALMLTYLLRIRLRNQLSLSCDARPFFELLVVGLQLIGLFGQHRSAYRRIRLNSSDGRCPKNKFNLTLANSGIHSGNVLFRSGD